MRCAGTGRDADLRERCRQRLARVFKTQPGRERARELGVVPMTERIVLTGLTGITGTYVFAAEFLLDPETNHVDAVGRVVVRVMENGVVLSSMRADQLTLDKGP